MVNSLNLTREQLSIITGGDSRAIKAFEDFFTTLNNLGLHAATHQPGGSDPLTVDAIPTMGSLRTLGIGVQKAAAGIHAATHLRTGGDPVDFAPYTDTAANLAVTNPVLASGQLGWESDTLSGKIGDGSTAYNTLTYFYRGLPVSSESSLGTPHGHQYQFITAGAQNVGAQNYDLSAQFPDGSGLLWVWGYWTTGAGGGGYIFIENSATVAGGVGFTPSAVIPGSVCGLIVLNNDKIVRLYVGDRNASAMNFFASPYWI